MDFFNKAIDSLSTAGKELGKQADNVSEVAKLSFKMQKNEKSLQENQLDVIQTIEESKINYQETIGKYCAQGSRSFMRSDITESQLDNLIRYTVDGLTKDQMQSNSFQPDMLFEQICGYLDTLQTLCTK